MQLGDKTSNNTCSRKPILKALGQNPWEHKSCCFSDNDLKLQGPLKPVWSFSLRGVKRTVVAGRKKNLATHNTDLCIVDEKGGGKAHNFKALIELLLQLLRLIAAVVCLSVAEGALEWPCMLLPSGVFRQKSPKRAQDHRRSIANPSVFHRPTLILVICLPFCSGPFTAP